jgi:hypothetical protein
MAKTLPIRSEEVLKPSSISRVSHFPWVISVTFIFACGLAYEPLYHIFRGSLAYSIIPQDDFYYYYLTAKHVAANGFSSFDGIVPTNGYHPLWMWCIAVLSFLSRGNDSVCFIMIEVVQILSSVVTAALTLKLFRELYGDMPWLNPIALLGSLLLTVLIFLGMETVVCIPLYILFFIKVYGLLKSRVASIALRNNNYAILAGVVGSLMAFARLDTLILVALTIILLIAYRVDRKKIFAFLLGLAPIAIYFAYNKICFGGWLPVSAQAKQLSNGFHFSFRAIEAIGTPRGSLYFLLTLIGYVLAIISVRRKHYTDPSAGVKILIFAFPLIFSLVLALRLSWSSYMWYFYPFPISAGAALFEMRERIPHKLRSWNDRLAPVALPIIMAFAFVILFRDIRGLTSHINLIESQTQAQPNIYIHALGIKPFTDSHPGRYAMGDRAGLTSFITGRPFLQMEGLAADQAMVDSISARADLLNVLRKYGVRYYVVSYPLREFHEHDWHWDLYEPHRQQVQPWASVMHGRFYAPEVFRFPAPVSTNISSADSATLWVTRILDISQSRDDMPEGK